MQYYRVLIKHPFISITSLYFTQFYQFIYLSWELLPAFQWDVNWLNKIFYKMPGTPITNMDQL